MLVREIPITPVSEQRLGRNNNLEVLIMKHSNNSRNTLENKKSKGDSKVVKEKFVEKREHVVKSAPLVAKTNAQKNYIQSLKENIISIASGHAGSGKSFCPSYMSAQMLLSGEIEKIFVTRPYAHLGADYGATTGDDYAKMLPFCRPTLDTIRKVLGDGKYNYCIDNGDIEISPLEKIQGRSFDENCTIIADEMQCATKPQAISLVTRLGEGVKFLAICGDPRQSIKGGDNTLDWIVRFFERNTIKNVGITYFTEQDCVRSGIVKDILVAFEREGGFYSNL